MNAPLDPQVRTVLDAYHAREEREAEIANSLNEQEFDARLDEFLLAIGADAGLLLHTLIRGARARRILELGSSYGYSTVWLADAARATGGMVYSLELAADKQAYARAMLARAGLSAHVELVPGDALETLASLPGPFDFVLIDLWKRLYVPCLDLVYPKLAPGALIAADNMTAPAVAVPRAREYQAHVRTLPELDSVLLPVGSGIELSRKRTEAGGPR
jgi:predicted O-methyltransferase YrrM